MKAKKLLGFILVGLLLTGSVMGIGYGMSAGEIRCTGGCTGVRH